MKTNKFKFIAALLIVLVGFSNAAMAVVGALAVGSNNAMAWASADTQASANDKALKLCNQSTPKQDCKLFAEKAVVRAEGGGRTGYGSSVVSIADAKKAALNSCGAKACKVSDVVTDPGFYSLAKSQELKDGGVIFHLAYAFDNSDEADKIAVARCKERSGAGCTVVGYGLIAGRIDKPAPTSIPTRQPAEQSCRPHTPTIRCSSQCTNGDCIVTYENGCRMRVQVQPNFDTFTNRWTYPSPSC